MSNLETNPLQFCNTCGFMLKPRGVYMKANSQEEYGSNKSGLVNFCNKCNKYLRNRVRKKMISLEEREESKSTHQSQKY